MATTSEKTLTARLEQDLLPAVKNAVARERELEQEHRQAGRQTAVVEAELRDYVEACEEAGKDPDPKRLDELRAKLRDAPVVIRPGLDGIEVLHPELEAKRVAARRVTEQRRQGLQAFLDENRVELAAERLAGDRAVAEALDQAVEAVAQLVAHWAERARYHVVTLGIAQDDVPGYPFRLSSQLVADYRRLRDEKPNEVVPAPRWITEHES
jgi:hypothetical protein